MFKCPCEACPYRKLLTYFDIHICGDECDIVCQEWLDYMNDKENKNEQEI